jgi:hypothetical protein
MSGQALIGLVFVLTVGASVGQALAADRIVDPDAAATITTIDAAAPDLLRRWSARGGTIGLRVNHDLLRQFGATLTTDSKADHHGRVHFELRDDTLQFSAHYGTIRSFDSGALTTREGLVLSQGDRREQLAWFALTPTADAPRSIALRDPRRRTWFVADRLMYRLDESAGSLHMPTIDLRIGPALAAWLGRPAAAGLVIAELTVDSRLTALSPAPATPKSCTAPEWHGTNGKLTDVLLEYVDVQQMRCKRGDDTTFPFTVCDGPNSSGGTDDGEVVFAPSASLRNSNTATTADVPWYEKFLPGTPLPPYNNDQHPILSWNMYRIDADGRIQQIGRSGAKHAWFTTNEECADPTCSGGNVLGRACRDVYTTGSNDLDFYLAPRSEIVPSRGLWGRCGSIFDNQPVAGPGGCDGVQDFDGQASPIGYAYRLAVRESAIERPANDGAGWLFESWYTVRDDMDIENTMGWIEVTPQWNGSQWVIGIVQGTPFRTGPAVDGWIAAGNQATQRNSPLSTPEGTARVAVKVTELGTGRWRYDYAVMNIDFARAVTAGAEPDLRVLEARGFGGISILRPQSAGITATAFAGVHAVGGNDWTATVTPPGASASVSFTANGGTDTLDWGTLFRFTIEANAPPVEGTVSLLPARIDAGLPSQYSVQSLIPGQPPLFADGFE